MNRPHQPKNKQGQHAAQDRVPLSDRRYQELMQRASMLFQDAEKAQAGPSKDEVIAEIKATMTAHGLSANDLRD